MLRQLWSSKAFALDAGLLVLRAGTGLLLANHGWEKLMNYPTWSKDFPDPLHVGSPISLAMCISAEFFASMFLVAGLLTRYALILLMINMVVITFLVHGNDPFDKQEHALLFLFPFVTLFLAGPGKYALDHALRK